jgi:hypothetical protein
VNTVTNNKPSKEKTNTNEIKSTKKTADAFNLYFSTIAAQLIEDTTKKNN